MLTTPASSVGYRRGDKMWVSTPIHRHGGSETLLLRYCGSYHALRKISDVNNEELPKATVPSSRRHPKSSTSLQLSATTPASTSSANPLSRTLLKPTGNTPFLASLSGIGRCFFKREWQCHSAGHLLVSPCGLTVFTGAGLSSSFSPPARAWVGWSVPVPLVLVCLLNHFLPRSTGSR